MSSFAARRCEACAVWLDENADGDALARVLRPLPPDELEMRPVSPAVNSAAYDGPQCQAPAPPRPLQGLLFPENEPR